MRKRKSTTKKSSLVRAMRALKGLSQGQLAERLGCSQAHISRIEKGEVTPPKSDATQLARALDVTPQTLFPNIEGHHDD